MSFIINEKEKELGKQTKQLTKFHKAYPGLKELTSNIDTLQKKQIFDPEFGHYKTTHIKDFPGYQSGLYAEAHRPPENGTEKSIRPPAESDWNTTAAANYSWKSCEKTEPIRSGTASGNRRNNPHPHDAFMNWKLNKNKVLADTKHLNQGKETSDVEDQERLKKILKDQLTSTYDKDYLDNTQDLKNIRKDAAQELFDWSNPKVSEVSEQNSPKNNLSNSNTNVKMKKWDAQVKEDLSTKQYLSSNTVTYRQPVHHRHLDDNTTRYGCNKNKMRAAIGAVPTVVHQYLENNSLGPNQTSYQDQFAKRK